MNEWQGIIAGACLIMAQHRSRFPFSLGRSSLADVTLFVNCQIYLAGLVIT
jgi:hypothetical protein